MENLHGALLPKKVIYTCGSLSCPKMQNAWITCISEIIEVMHFESISLCFPCFWYWVTLCVFDSRMWCILWVLEIPSSVLPCLNVASSLWALCFVWDVVMIFLCQVDIQFHCTVYFWLHYLIPFPSSFTLSFLLDYLRWQDAIGCCYRRLTWRYLFLQHFSVLCQRWILDCLHHLAMLYQSFVL